jgi:basic membrane protein A
MVSDMDEEGGRMFRRSTLLRLTATLVVLAAVLVAGCASPAAETTVEEEAPLKVALVLPGSIADQGYNAAAYAGLMSIEEEFGAEVAFTELVPLAEYEETFRDYAAEGYDVIIGHGYEFGDPIEVVAPEFPETSFLVVNGSVSGDNYASLSHQNYQAAYVAGHICARMSETKRLGSVGGFAYPIIIQLMEGFRVGAEATDPDIEVTISYLDSFDDVGLGKEATLAQISAGADCVFHVADAAGIGVIQACEEEGVWAVGFAADQNELAPDTVLTSTIIDYAEMLRLALKDITEGTFEFNKVYLYGMDSGVIRLADYHGLVPDDIAAEAEELQRQIISGELEVPVISEPSQ